MKKILLILVLAFSMQGCERKPDFIKDGQGYYKYTRCIKDTTYREWGYKYGISWRGRLEGYWGYSSKYECLKYVIDTVKIK